MDCARGSRDARRWRWVLCFRGWGALVGEGRGGRGGESPRESCMFPNSSHTRLSTDAFHSPLTDAPGTKAETLATSH